MLLENLTVEEIRTGLQEQHGVWHCLECGAAFQPGEVYPVGGRYYTAGRAAAEHARTQHPQRLQGLIHDDSKYNNLTENQTRLLLLFAGGKADKDIANELGLSLSTVRHQKFMFREKAKSAKLYLAVFEGVFGGGVTDIAPVHQNATGVDERYVVTEAERAKILRTFFESETPLKLKAFPPKEKKKLVILARIAQQFAPGQSYTEAEVNAILLEIYWDCATLRRYLVDYGFMKRNRSGSSYTLA